MKILETPLKDLVIIEPNVFEDARGYFMESYKQSVLEPSSGSFHIIQENESFSRRGALRGLHYQEGEYAQAKLVRVIEGEVLDIAVDLRENSPTFGAHFSVELSSENKKQLFIPRGFAHAFVALEDNTIFQYKVDNYYSGVKDGGVIWNDEELAITWPEFELELSEKDKNLPKLNQLDLNTLW